MSQLKKSSAKDKGQTFRTLKGMRDVIGDDFYQRQGFYEKAAEVAVYYGFKPIATPIIEREEVFSSSVGEASDIVEKEMYRLKNVGRDKLVLRPEGTAGVVRAYIENGMQSMAQPVMLYYLGSFFRHDNPQRGRFREFGQFGLEVIGSDKAVADALVIKVASLILEEAGLENLSLEINSIGDKECRGDFKKELTNYYKKHIGEICPDCNRRIKNNPLRLLDCKNPKCLTLKEKAPDPVAYLCDSCKKHFKEVLEYLESMNVTYILNKNLVRGLDYYSRTVFEITEINEEETEEEPLAVASGGRYDYLAKMVGSARDIPAVGVAIGTDRVLMSEKAKKMTPRIMKKPKIFFIQLGFDAKLKSIEVIEILRKAKIPIRQSLSKDSLGVQLAGAEKLKIPHVIIMGQKEVSDKTVIVRQMENRSQKTVKLDKLVDYLKKL